PLVPGLEGRPEGARPLPFLGETLLGLRAAPDVVRERGLPASEGRLFVGDVTDGAAHLPDRERRQRRLDLQRPLDGDVDDVVGQLRNVAALEVVPTAVRKA